jgi:hypothetical protein
VSGTCDVARLAVNPTTSSAATGNTGHAGCPGRFAIATGPSPPRLPLHWRPASAWGLEPVEFRADAVEQCRFPVGNGARFPDGSNPLRNAPADGPVAVELLGQQRPVIPQQNCVGRAGDLGVGADVVDQSILVTLWGMVISAPQMLVRVKTDRKKSG